MVGPYTDNKTPSSVKGADFADNVLSLLALIYGSSSSWCTIVFGFYVHYPADVSHLKVFILTTLGIAVPTSIGMPAGATVARAPNNQPTWKVAYTDPHKETGFLIREMLDQRVFAKIVLVLFSCTGIHTNITSTQPAISFQQMARPLAKISRTILCFAVVLALVFAGRQKLNIYLQDFLSL
ncbi:hypothetical protein V8C35DRAFT_283735 [Trichoderma chlorosporum]